MRRKFGPSGLVLIALCGQVLSLPGHAGEWAGDASRGKIRSKAELCQECHGETGQGTAEHYPKLAGQWPAYIAKQLLDFQSGARKNEIMTAMAADLSRQDIADIAAYFSSVPPWQATAGNFSARGESLFLNGDAARDLPSCAFCHGADAAGSGQQEAPVPALAGQNQSYLANQLFFWKVDERRNNEGGAMNAVAHGLTAEDIDALAKFLSGIPAEMRIAH